MLKISIFIFFIAFPLQLFSQIKSVKVSGSISLTNNGIDPVPAFALGKPALMSSLSITKGNFIFNTLFNYSITEIKPWSQNFWFLYKIPFTEKNSFRTGLSLSFFHKKENVNVVGNQNLSAQILNQYPTLETSFTHLISKKSSFSLNNWAVRGIEMDAIQWGNFTSFGFNFSELKISKSFQMNLMPNIFYLTNASSFKGLFVSESASLFYKNSKLGISNQFVLPILTSPKTKYNWNIGLVFKF